ncbi:hypothetical protein GJ688_13910 [Heliobacillus mobilis]|uniref:Uncharacterized protein n=1 Tax=Heliobacterium mobile TaxID=28064 RepID=A0A6I3SP90_HELMO|nr:hypothetical protein [Heliobacterium mobile]MTV50067.1 hypothetical protein [Heliobacterium mobile]
MMEMIMIQVRVWIRKLSACALMIVLLVGIYATTVSSSPKEAIKKYVFLKGHFFQAMNLTIESTEINDDYYGHQFIVRGYRESKSEIIFFYLKQNVDGWYVVSAGTGP